MVDGIGNSSSATRAEAVRTSATQRGQQLAPTDSGVKGGAGTKVSSAVSDIAAAGPPVDTDKVTALRAAIAGGTYAIDADAIAGKMIDLDLPGAGA